MAQKKRSVIVSATIYQWLEMLVATGQYSDLDDAATDLLMQVKRGVAITPPITELNYSSVLPIQVSTDPVPPSTAKLMTSTGKKAMDELLSMEF